MSSFNSSLFERCSDTMNLNHSPHLLITGGAGLIGTASRNYFEQKGWTVSTLDLQRYDLDGREIDYVGDVVDFKSLREILDDVDGVLHLAAVSRVIDAELNKAECTRVNVEGTKRVLEAAALSKCRWFIFGSSREVYGEQTTFPVSESIEVAPINHYGREKVNGERLVKSFCEIHEIAHSNLRFSNVYGHSNDHHTRLVNAFILRALKSESLEIHGGGQIFDFTHIDDTTEAIFHAAKILNDTHASLPPIHVLPGEAVSIEDLAAMIIKITGSNSNIIYTAARNYDVEHFHGTPSLMNEVLGFKCSIDIISGLHKCIIHHREKVISVTGVEV